MAILAIVAWCYASTALAPGWLAEQYQAERVTVANWFGHSKEEEAWRRASDIASRTAKAGRLPMPGSLSKPEAQPRESNNGFDWGAIPTHGLMDVWRQAVYRALVIAMALVYLVPFAVATTVDGITVRRIKATTYTMENPRIYHIAKQVLIAVVAIPIVFAALPANVSPILLYAWAALILLTIWGMTQNVEATI